MASNRTCVSTAAEDNWVIVVQFPKTFAERLCCTIAQMLFFLCLGLVILFLVSAAWLWIPPLVGDCHRASGLRLENFTIEKLVLFQANPNLTGSPWLVNSSFYSTYWAWNEDTVTRCFSSFRELEVIVEYQAPTEVSPTEVIPAQTLVILQQLLPLQFSLKPKKGRYFTMELNATNVQLGGNAELGSYMQAEMESPGNVLVLDVYYAVEYLTAADTKSTWENNWVSCSWPVSIRNFTCDMLN